MDLYALCRLSLILLAAVAWGVPSRAATLHCSDMDVEVSAQTPALAKRVCTVAQNGRDLLNACNLFQTAAFKINVVPEMPLKHAGCFGVYECEESRVEILDPAGMAAAIQAGDPLSHIPADAFFDSALIHELAHVFVYQTRGGPGRNIIEDEYIAYAMQVASLPVPVRDKLLEVSGVAVPTTLDGINPFILMLSPDVFRARVYLHFATEGNGCAFVQDVLNGKANFVLDAP